MRDRRAVFWRTARATPPSRRCRRLAGGRRTEEGGALLVHRSQAEADRLAAVAGVPVSEIKVLSGEQSNTSVGVGRLGILKFYRACGTASSPNSRSPPS